MARSSGAERGLLSDILGPRRQEPPPVRSLVPFVVSTASVVFVLASVACSSGGVQRPSGGPATFQTSPVEAGAPEAAAAIPTLDAGGFAPLTVDTACAASKSTLVERPAFFDIR